jgi:hypothetical protein
MSPSSNEQPSPEIERSILALATETRPLMRLGRRRTIAIVFVVAMTALATMRPRADLATLPLASMVLVTVIVATLAFFGLGVATSIRRFTGAPARALLAIAIGAPLVYALATAARPVHGIAEVPVPPTWMCLAMAAMVAMAGLAALVAAFRYAVPVAPRARGAALGAAAGAWAGLAMHLRCPSGDPVHILVGHAVPIALVAMLGAVVAPRFVRP